jgi:esterase/lipase superfamily enzyme
MGRADPLRSFVVTKYAPVSSRDLKQWVFTESGAKRKLLVFVHGFNTTFAEAVYGFAQIVRDSGAETRPVLFSWPSAGGPLNYLYDVNSATFSRDDLEFVLTRAVNDPNINEIAVMAHSLGNWLLMETLRQMSIRKGRIDPKIKNVIMADPDIDIDVFHKQLDRIGGPRPRTTIFTSRDDKALEISKNLAGNVVRVGDLNPNLSKYRSRLDRYNIVIVDLTKASAGDAWDHAKFDDDPLIIRQIGKRLFADRELWTSRPVEGEQVIGGPIAAIASATISGLRAVGHTEPWERSRR